MPNMLIAVIVIVVLAYGVLRIARVLSRRDGKVICTKCQNRNRSGATFCSQCGARMTS